MIGFVIALVVLGAASAVGMAWFAAGVRRVVVFNQEWIGWGSGPNPAPNLGNYDWASWHRRAQSRDRHEFEHGDWQPRGANGLPAQPVTTLPEVDEIYDRIVVAEFGWPWPTLESRFTLAQGRLLDGAQLVVSGMAIRGWDVDLGAHGLKVEPVPIDTRGRDTSAFAALPLRVLPLGALLSWCVWTLAWAVLLGAMPMTRFARRWYRRRAGRCGECGHVLRPGSVRSKPLNAPCPECGSRPDALRALVSRRLLATTIAVALLVIGANLALAIALHVGRRPASELHRAASAGDMVAIDRLLASGVSVDLPDDRVIEHYDPTHATPLMWAAAAGHLDATRRLLGAGADPNALDHSGMSVLVHAAASGSREVVTALIDAGARQDLQASVRGMPLCLLAFQAAIAGGHASVVSLLLSVNPCVADLPRDSGAPGDFDFGWLLAAAAPGPSAAVVEEILATLLARGSERQVIGHALDDWECIEAAARMGRTETIRALIAAGASPDGQSSGEDPLEGSPLLLAIAGQHVDTALALLAAGASVDCRRGSVLASAIAAERPELLEPLLSAGADPNCFGYVMFGPERTPLAAAVFQGDVASSERLIHAGARLEDPAHGGAAGLLALIPGSRSDARVIHLVMRSAPDIDARDSHGRTVLMRVAASLWPRSCIEAVLEHGADPLLTDAHGLTALQLAQNAASSSSRWMDAFGRAEVRAVVGLLDDATRAARSRRPGSAPSTSRRERRRRQTCWPAR